MSHVCPACDGRNVRRSSTPTAERTWRDTFFGRYRCRDCMQDFWRVRRKTYVACAALVVAIALAVIAVVVMDRMFEI